MSKDERVSTKGNGKEEFCLLSFQQQKQLTFRVLQLKGAFLHRCLNQCVRYVSVIDFFLVTLIKVNQFLPDLIFPVLHIECFVSNTGCVIAFIKLV